MQRQATPWTGNGSSIMKLACPRVAAVFSWNLMTGVVLPGRDENGSEWKS
jgi:hypothetical protein